LKKFTAFWNLFRAPSHCFGKWSFNLQNAQWSSWHQPPVKNLKTGKGEITSQNHGFAVKEMKQKSHPDLEITHLHLNDNTVAGLAMKNKKCFSVQYHPEASPGPHDSSYLFDEFIALLK